MSLQGLEVELHPRPLVLCVQETVGVAAVAVDVAHADRQAAIGHQDGDLVHRFGREGPEVPHRGGRTLVRFGVPLLRVDEVGEFIGIADKENGRVVADHVPVALVGIKLQGKAADVTLCVGGAGLARDVGEAGEHRRLPAHVRKKASPGEAGDVVRHGEFAQRAPTLGVDGAIGDPLAIEMRQLFQQLVVLHEDRPVRPRGQSVLVAGDGRAAGRGQRFVFVHDGVSVA